MKRIFIFVVLAVCAVMFSGCGNDSSLDVRGGDSKSDRQRDESVVYIAVSPDNEPFEYIDGDGDLNGFDIALAMKLCEELDRTPVFVQLGSSDIFSSLNCGITEMALSSLESDDNKRQRVDFSNDYITLSSAIVKSVYDTRVSNVYSLGSVRNVAVAQDSFSDKYLTDELGLSNIMRFSDSYSAAAAFENGTCGALFTDSSIAAELAYSNSEYVISQNDIGQKKYSVAVAKGNSALIKQLNEIIGRFRRDGTLADLRRAYLGSAADVKEVFTSEVKAVQNR